MKKFVSIVIALVMVLSMTSAFAWTLDCSVNNFAWDCPTDTLACGKGSVEIVPFVKANAACDGWEYVESDCASAIKSEKVFFAVKLTVEANPNKDWWKKAELTIEAEGLKNFKVADPTAVVDASMAPANQASIDWTEDETVEYYLANDLSGWVKVSKADLKDVVFSAVVADADEAEVCATLTSEHKGIGTFTWNGYTVKVTKAPAAGVDYSIQITHEDYLATTDFVYIGVENGKVSVVNSGNAAFYAKAAADFNLNACAIGTCINADTIQANFGWDFEQEDCFDWSEVGATTVNPECAVTVDIPKTGDVSVVAYAVMAIVAAAGTMLKK